MSFVVAPFLILHFYESILVWSQVYFYVPVGVILSIAFFASPGKQILKQRLAGRQKKTGIQLARTSSQDSISGREPVLGVAADPQRELDEALQELRGK